MLAAYLRLVDQHCTHLVYHDNETNIRFWKGCCSAVGGHTKPTSRRRWSQDKSNAGTFIMFLVFFVIVQFVNNNITFQSLRHIVHDLDKWHCAIWSWDITKPFRVVNILFLTKMKGNETPMKRKNPVGSSTRKDITTIDRTISSTGRWWCNGDDGDCQDEMGDWKAAPRDDGCINGCWRTKRTGFGRTRSCVKRITNSRCEKYIF